MRQVGGFRTLWWTALFLAVAGCRAHSKTPGATGRGVPPLVSVRAVRVLLAGSHRRCRVRVDGSVAIRDGRGRIELSVTLKGWTVIRVGDDGRILLGDRVLGGGPHDLIPDPGSDLELSHPKSGEWSQVRKYDGFLRLSSSPKGRLVVINFVDLETYVTCVLPGEIPSQFEREAFRAQAVAVRTYVLFRMARRAHEPYDVSATEASQVYPGLGSGKSAQQSRRAAEHTRGIVATWTSPAGERIFCTFYSSCCGGQTQSAANCGKDARGVSPLAGGVSCKCSRIAPAKAARWGPVRRSKSEVTSKLVRRFPRLRRLGRVESIRIIDQTHAGRIKRLRLVGGDGEASDLSSEDFRLALGSRVVRSTIFKIRRGREHFEFTDGRGFGHGMGLCQWGMQEMALRGHHAGAILKHYYPTMNLTRAY